MARPRMIGVSVFESDTFLDLPDAAKALYPYIILKADDNGLLNNMKTLLRTFGINDSGQKKFANGKESRVIKKTGCQQLVGLKPT
jgi:hypothetical protein